MDVLGAIIITMTPAKTREQVPLDTEAQLYIESHSWCDMSSMKREAEHIPACSLG